MVYFLSVLAV